MRVLDIIHGTIVDGPGLRTSIYFAGCKHHCFECHNPESWNFNGGKEMSVEEIMKEIKDNMFNVTLSGGDPLFQNIDELTSLAKQIHSLGLEICVYTGYVFEQLIELKIYNELLEYIDVVVDGPFENDKKDTSLSFRGSSNQRILKVICENNEGNKKITYKILNL